MARLLITFGLPLDKKALLPVGFPTALHRSFRKKNQSNGTTTLLISIEPLEDILLLNKSLVLFGALTKVWLKQLEMKKEIKREFCWCVVSYFFFFFFFDALFIICLFDFG